jgi:hypothetical protein
MDFDSDEYYSISVSHGKKIGPRRYHATADIIRRDTKKPVGDVEGIGGAMTTAERNAKQNAINLAGSLGRPPKNWKKQ